jgi:O-antigen ligase
MGDSLSAATNWLRIEFWLPVATVFTFCMVVSADQGYAAIGGDEVYNPRVLSNIIRQVAFLGLGSVGGLMLLRGSPASAQSHPAWTIVLPVILLMIYMLASVLWSDDPETTFKRSITALLVVVTGLGIGRVWDAKNLSWGIVLISGLFLAAGILTELRYRSFLAVDEYRFSGLFHPAKQAFNCGFLLLASLAIYLRERRAWMLLIVGVAATFLILTKARTGTAAALVSAVWLISQYSNIRGWLILGIAGVILSFSGLLLYQGATGQSIETQRIATMGRNEESADPTKLTGRLPIWRHAIQEVADRPILGHGYGAFWTVGRLAEFERLNGWALYHAHSTYLETLLNVGLVGLVIGVLTIFLVLHRSQTLIRQGYVDAALVSALILMAALGGLFEIAFINLEYESIVLMAAIGTMIFSVSPQIQASSAYRRRVSRNRR